ncbi:MAG: YdcH family protein [Pseudomonadota bacterium]
MDEIYDLEEKLVELEHEHQDLDQIIDRLRNPGPGSPPADFLQIKRLQKKKLILKDQIERIKSEMIPDIIA